MAAHEKAIKSQAFVAVMECNRICGSKPTKSLCGSTRKSNKESSVCGSIWNVMKCQCLWQFMEIYQTQLKVKRILIHEIRTKKITIILALQHYIFLKTKQFCRQFIKYAQTLPTGSETYIYTFTNATRSVVPLYVVKCSSLLGCDTVLQCKWFLTVQSTILRLLDPKDESITNLQNVENYLTINTASHPGQLQSSSTHSQISR